MGTLRCAKPWNTPWRRNCCKRVTTQLSNDLKSFTLRRESFIHGDGKHLTAADFHRSGCSIKSLNLKASDRELNMNRQKNGGIYGRRKHFYSKYTLRVKVKSIQHEDIVLPSGLHWLKLVTFCFLIHLNPEFLWVYSSYWNSEHICFPFLIIVYKINKVVYNPAGWESDFAGKHLVVEAGFTCRYLT